MKGSAKIALIYLVCGLAWIFLSDNWLQESFGYNKELSRLQTYKGFFFIGITALLLFFLVNMFYKQLAVKIEKLKDINAAIEKQNAQLQDIAHMQSHVVRAPLATMMGFVHLLEETKDDDEDKDEMLKNILLSANELDAVIRQISDKTQDSPLVEH